jgi:hypothetical protein
MNWLDGALWGWCVVCALLLCRGGQTTERRVAMLMIALAAGFAGVMLWASIVEGKG